MSYGLNLLIAIDQFVNAALAGWPDETLSARSWRCRDRMPYKLFRVLIDALFFFDKNHCQTSYESEKLHKYLPPEER